MQSLCVNAILFTLQEKQPKDNPYISVFLIWLSTLCKNGGLTSDDLFVLTTDEATSEYLEDKYIFNETLLKLKCNFTLRILPAPSTLLEGMMWKYIPVDGSYSVYMYCDIDILIIRSLHLITDNIEHSTIAVNAQGSIQDYKYGEAFSNQELDNFYKDTPGFNAGIFCVKGQDLINQLFAKIQAYYTENINVKYYTVEQPLFNRAIHLFPSSVFTLNLQHLASPILTNNGNDINQESTILFDCNGEPGNSSLHLSKVVEVLCGFYLNLFSFDKN